MSYILLMNILESFDRDELELLAISSRRIMRIIQKQFPLKPFRVCDNLEIQVNLAGNLTVCLRNGTIELLPDRSNMSEFKVSTGYVLTEKMANFFPVDNMLPFLGETVRFKTTIFWTNIKAKIGPEHISVMEKLKHLWSQQCLVLTPEPSLIFQTRTMATIAEDYHHILGSHAIVQSCRDLRVYGIDVNLSQYHHLYGLEIVKVVLANTQISASTFVNFIAGVGKQKSHAIVCFEHFTKMAQLVIWAHVRKIRKVFMGERTPLAFKINLLTLSAQGSVISEFEERNLHTNERLRLRAIVGQEKTDLCSLLYNNGHEAIHSCDVFLFERQLMR